MDRDDAILVALAALLVAGAVGRRSSRRVTVTGAARGNTSNFSAPPVGDDFDPFADFGAGSLVIGMRAPQSETIEAITFALPDLPGFAPENPFRAAPVDLVNGTARGQVWQKPTVFDAVFQRASAESGLPPGLLKRVAWQESRFRPRAHNASSDASGIMQIVPRWHPGVDPWDPDEAIPYAARYLATLHRQFNSWRLALAAYNWGPGNLAADLADGRTDFPSETRKYVASVSADVGLA